MARNKFDVDESLEKNAEFNFAHLKRMAGYTKPYRREIFTTVAAMMSSSALALAPPYLLKIAIDTAIPEKSIQMIVILSLIALATTVANVFLVRYRVLTMSRVGQFMIRDLRLDLFMRLQKLPFSYYDSRPHGKILVRVVNYVNSLSDMLSNGIINMITDLFSLVVIIIIMFSLNVRLSLVCMAGVPFLIIAINIIKTKQRAAWSIYSAKSSNLNAYIHESISGMKITQGFVREDENMGIFLRVAGSVKDTWMKAVKIMFLLVPTAENISVWTVAFFYICAAAWIGGADGITVGVVVAFVGYIGRFWGPINNIANVYNAVVVNMTYMERIFETIDEPEVVKDIPGAVIMPVIRGDVCFNNVTFSYEKGHPVLNDVSFSCSSGDSIALVGPTGAGKTTIVNLISRFYDLDFGQVTIDGTDIKTVTLKSLRSQMGIMLQDSFIFSGTIMDNIRYSRADATDEEVIEASKAVRADDFISEMENGYKTEVHERGSRLSVGQRQLISFARALLADPKILILDEATSSIDTKTELLVQKGLNKLLAGRTSFIIAHRLSTIKNCTKIMYIDKGVIIEEGDHNELMRKKGAYYDLYRAQYAFLNNA